jgi:anti-anti-sigma regulatory factor
MSAQPNEIGMRAVAGSKPARTERTARPGSLRRRLYVVSPTERADRDVAATRRQIPPAAASTESSDRHEAAPVCVVVSPLGALEGGRVALFRRRMALLSAEPGADVVVDLAAVPVLDTAAAQSIVDARSRLGRRGGRLRLVRAGAQPREAVLAAAARSRTAASPTGPGAPGVPVRRLPGW